MRKILIFLMVFVSVLVANFIDNDLDGVDDRVDKCLDTPFNALVDEDGCPTKMLDISYEEKAKYDFYTEISKVKDDSYQDIGQLFYCSISKNRYYLTISSLLNSVGDENSIYDVTIKVKKYYNILYNFYVAGGVGLKIPTKNISNNKNNIDIPLYLSTNYSFDNKSFFVGGSYTIVNDKSDYLNYKNSKFFYAGFSYTTKNSLMSINYMIDKDKFDETSKSLGFVIYFMPSKSYYISLGYTKSLNSYAIDSTYSFGVGKTF